MCDKTPQLKREVQFFGTSHYSQAKNDDELLINELL